MFTVFTPTFNRESTLRRCYDSVINQGRVEIEWIIVDDGSTDNTRNLVESFINEGKIKIHYIYQSNSGKQSAWNRAVQEASGEFFIGLDSDDELVESALLNFTNYLHLLRSRNDLLGLRCLAIRKSTGKADSLFQVPGDHIASWYDEFASGFFGERIDIFKTRLLVEYLYPVTVGLKFIPEIWFYSVISKKYKFIYLNEPLCIFHDQALVGRLSKSTFYKHARGHRISRGAMLKNIPLRSFMKNPMGFIKTIVRYVQAVFCCILKVNRT
ncbi:glycosyltransferase family A protein [Edwardsiella piscicida]|uniref:glycosyltransferase family A protein n=1 Tax=Edwardsiella piscicida TaxID=1263550 RepID=UPI0002C14408|nr:glycosyltransferase family A protein [Edwardsiella piscicida]AGH73263.1 family 2 glycosyl transferase [Edwardsiella piscicida C07-087]EKS7778949.1 glycosyltransferase family 2 protein [Edwardsiella piscicida]EKS7782369.1 glycosyltransferase family 2 protein [Edwardsiella piscicida]EKS7791932.1 glycosyltransferase family 2 protein [Edwardsiella piscicida]EKS7812046.1 glycosyltransferase family 2 protein [Edwardsiella piscicida]